MTENPKGDAVANGGNGEPQKKVESAWSIPTCLDPRVIHEDSRMKKQN